jgi:hypothetical protein
MMLSNRATGLYEASFNHCRQEGKEARFCRSFHFHFALATRIMPLAQINR